MNNNTTFNKDFKHDLKFGEANEKSLAALLNLDTVEVKTERGDFSNPKSWVNTNNRYQPHPRCIRTQ